ncbi:MAG TPA: acetate--CoA ligase family protein, partial [Alphaproteobacteria bacterium]|nr:acetate--CoA ligase family protein [Alphaproteobacteria bacterium]
LAPLLQPRSLAVIGASSNIHSLRGRIMAVMRRHAFAGPIYPISRSEAEIAGLKTYPSITEVPGPVDLAIVIIPAKYVPDTLEECGRAGVRAVQIITSGFAEEAGSDGAAMQTRIAEIGRRHGMLVCGPNSEGFINTRAALAPTFSPAADFDGELYPAHAQLGAVSVIAQSGGVGFAFFDRGRERDLPFAYVVSTGNEADVDVTDLLHWMLEEGSTDVFIIFVENVRDGGRFRRAAARALREGKPLIVLKIGRSAAGARAALSHTAAIVGSYGGFHAVAERYGLIEAGDVDEAVELAAGLAAWRGMEARGRRVGIFTASGGAGGLTADASVAAGLEVPPLDAETRRRIDAHLPPYGSSQNPVDATAQAIGELGYASLVELIAESPVVDQVIAIASARLPARFEKDREPLIRAGKTVTKPVAFWSYTQPSAMAARVLAEAGFPLFTNLRNATRALAAFAALGERRAALDEPVQDRGPADAAAAEAVRRALPVAGGALCEYEVKPLLAAYGLATAPETLCRSAAEAIAALHALRGPVALKLQSPDLPHKSDLGLLLLGLDGATAVSEGYETLMQRAAEAAPQAELRGVLVQPMAPAGLELIVGVSRDDTFGPMLTVGLGGIYAEVLQDTVTLPAPLSEAEAKRGITRLRGSALLTGARGQPARDINALADLLVRLSRLASDNADAIREIDLNPVILHEAGRGLSIADALLVADPQGG